MPTTYHEIVVQTPRGWGLGFIRGYMHGRDKGGLILDAELEGFGCESLKEQMSELLDRSSDVLHLLVPEDLLPLVREAIQEGATVRGTTKILRERKIHGARFSFSFRIFSREHGRAILERCGNLPDGVRLSEDACFKEVEDPEAEGVELYAPTHHYELRGKGAFEGSVDGIVQLYRYCRMEDLIHQEAAELIPSGE